MKRTKFKDTSLMTLSGSEANDRLAIYTALLSRAQLAAKLGYQYDGNRDVYEALGYPKQLYYTDYFAKYERHDIAKAVVKRPITAAWRGQVRIEQAGVDNETSFEKMWKKLWISLGLKSRFIRLDKLSTLGEYGVLLLGLDDMSNGSDWRRPVKSGTRELLYVRPLSQQAATISTIEKDRSNPRYGLPETYNIALANADGSSGPTLSVHHSRVIHVPGELLESETYGEPALKCIFNRLIDLERIVGGSGEMFWRGARPGYQGEVDKDFTVTDTMRQLLEAQLDEFENNLRRFMINEGISLKALETQVADPRNHVLVQLQMISAETGIPIRILIGSERGELASTEDKTTWLELVQTRQEDYMEMQILRPFIERCIDYGVLPKPGRRDYQIIWPDLFSPSEKERAEIGKIRASALQSYLNNPKAPLVVPPEIFYEFMLGLTNEELEHVKRVHEMSKEDLLNVVMDKLDDQNSLTESSEETVESTTIHSE